MNTGYETRWLLFTASLSGQAASSVRVKVWRALKELGAATLRDGVALLPVADDHRMSLSALVEVVEGVNGIAWILEVPCQQPDIETALTDQFRRDEAYRAFMDSLSVMRVSLPEWDEIVARRELRKLERALSAVVRIDFFPGRMREDAEKAFDDLASEVNRHFSPGEPQTVAQVVPACDAADFQQRTWATRKRLWIDRVASAWLIRRFIDAGANFLWLEKPEDCPKEALGFDYDGATFTHIGDRVTFEVLLASFGLESDTGLQRLGRLVHYLDVGGVPVDEAPGFEAVLAGLRDTATDDDALLAAVTPVLDALYRRFSNSAT